jgi:hypothetical protein
MELAAAGHERISSLKVSKSGSLVNYQKGASAKYRPEEKLD